MTAERLPRTGLQTRFAAWIAIALLGSLAACADPPVPDYRLDYAEPLAEGRLAIVRGDYARAFELLEPRAKQGHAEAQNALGVLYLEGWGVERDFDEAHEWISLAAEQRSPKAMHNLGRMNRNGWGARKSSAHAAYWYRKAAEAGYPPAQAVLGAMYHNGEGVDVDHARARQWLRLAAAQGEPAARAYLLEHFPASGE